MDDNQPGDEPSGPRIEGELHFSYDEAEATAGEVQAWEQIDAGRYMPRRIKGSCKGRALG
jgi:hypothetical protein